jgi:hypothetical protein
MTGSATKYVSYALTGLMVITIIVAAMFYLGGETEENSGVPRFTDILIYLTYIFFAIAALMAVVFPIIALIFSPKSALSAIVGVGIIGVIFLIGYFLSDGTLIDLPDTYEGGDNNPTTLKMTDTGLYAMYILLFLSIAGIVVSSVMNIFKK